MPHIRMCSVRDQRPFGEAVDEYKCAHSVRRSLHTIVVPLISTQAHLNPRLLRPVLDAASLPIDTSVIDARLPMEVGPADVDVSS